MAFIGFRCNNLISSTILKRLSCKPLYRTVTSKQFYTPDPDKPAPWPYKERGYRWWHQYIDGTTKRLDENSRLIVVEGNIGSGKGKFSRELAEMLGFHYIPAVNLDDIFVDSYGVDRRHFYHLLPESCRFFDAKLFYENPRHKNVANFQYMMFYSKVENYLNSLAHLMNTGQGVVTERIAHSDFVFVKAMHEQGFLSDDCTKWSVCFVALFLLLVRSVILVYDYYFKLRKHILATIPLFPHLVIYLDCPPWENNGKVIDFSYLETIENGYKEYLKQADDESVIMVYDWENSGEVALVVEDIEKVDLDTYEWHKNNKFEGWHNIASEVWWCYRRWQYTSKVSIMRHFCTMPCWDVPEMLIHPDDHGLLTWVAENVITGKYSSGYNTEKGDSFWKIFFSSNIHNVANASWYDHFFRDGWYYHNRRMYAPVVYLPNIPEEELKPREFIMRDNKVLSS
ncbi:NADH dehydrogenase [ubiquinone] 1 alpha subcomplex subunit 10, mitochondrial [Trichinella pseudospiralis]|uniref:NADH dehydrogenase [ubiquinone] 1 alpha subcomplex subunit 10, mitochondrial n=1 Tax=Trichinella pseudospiralis TaxID=6337 RepID=A0A0V1G2G3_TRIPS|nr:NADH dehydrogenase [ubiquinone] 1 alpha subcomplex subunit 10, mitochondrial [Trichinella pseudospiralis]